MGLRNDSLNRGMYGRHMANMTELSVLSITTTTVICSNLCLLMAIVTARIARMYRFCLVYVCVCPGAKN